MPKYRVTDKAGNEIRKGDTITDFRGDTATFDLVTRGTEYNGTAKIGYTQPRDGKPSWSGESYARVWGLTVETLPITDTP